MEEEITKRSREIGSLLGERVRKAYDCLDLFRMSNTMTGSKLPIIGGEDSYQADRRWRKW